MGLLFFFGYMVNLGVVVGLFGLGFLLVFDVCLYVLLVDVCWLLWVWVVVMLYCDVDVVDVVL